MDYEKIYKQIIKRRQENPLHEDEYGENHHIIPKSLGGSDNKDNLVRLSAREHFICHMLLAEMYSKGSNEWYKMNHAFIIMKSNSMTQMRYINNRYYELKRKDFSITQSRNQSGIRNSGFETVWIHSMTEQKSLKIHKSLLSDYLKNGYELGRVCNWDKKLNPEKYVKKLITPPVFYYNGRKINGRCQLGVYKIFNLVGHAGFKELHEKLIDLYINKQLNTTEIAKNFNTYNQRIFKYIQFFNIPTRSHSESYRLSIPKIKQQRKQ